MQIKDSQLKLWNDFSSWLLYLSVTYMSVLFSALIRSRQRGRELWALAHAGPMYEPGPAAAAWTIKMKMWPLALNGPRPFPFKWRLKSEWLLLIIKPLLPRPWPGIEFPGGIVDCWLICMPQTLVVTAEAFWAYQQYHQRRRRISMVGNKEAFAD